VILTHWLSYRWVFPEAGHRHTALETSGHGNWSFVVAFALAIMVAGLARFICHDLLGSDIEEGHRSRTYRSVAGRLVLLQGLGYITLEGAERVFSGGHLTSLLHEPAVVVGVLVQVFIAVAIAALLLALTRVVYLIRRTRYSPRAVRTTTVRAATSYRFAFTPQIGTGNRTLRGPPL
jgi:hypothetical protein